MQSGKSRGCFVSFCSLQGRILCYGYSVVTDSPIPLFGGSGVYINGGTIGGLDLMAVFTKNFWDKKGRDRRERTLEVLRAYGDSTTVLINKPIEQIIR